MGNIRSNDERLEAHTPRSSVSTFGVVTPTLNAERYFEQTLDSIWSQVSDRVKVDHVIVDGGSTDGTLDIAGRYPSRAVVSTDDRGMYDAVNRGITQVRGDIVGYINADDEIAPGAFRAVAELFGRDPRAQWVCGRVEYIDGDGGVLGAMSPVLPTLEAYIGIGWTRLSTHRLIKLFPRAGCIFCPA